MSASHRCAHRPTSRSPGAYVHAGMVGYDGEKMSKSRGNLVSSRGCSPTARTPWRCGWPCSPTTTGPTGSRDRDRRRRRAAVARGCPAWRRRAGRSAPSGGPRDARAAAAPRLRAAARRRPRHASMRRWRRRSTTVGRRGRRRPPASPRRAPPGPSSRCSAPASDAPIHAVHGRPRRSRQDGLRAGAGVRRARRCRGGAGSARTPSRSPRRWPRGSSAVVLALLQRADVLGDLGVLAGQLVHPGLPGAGLLGEVPERHGRSSRSSTREQGQGRLGARRLRDVVRHRRPEASRCAGPASRQALRSTPTMPVGPS